MNSSETQKVESALGIFLAFAALALILALAWIPHPFETIPRICLALERFVTRHPSHIWATLIALGINGSYLAHIVGKAAKQTDPLERIKSDFDRELGRSASHDPGRIGRSVIAGLLTGAATWATPFREAFLDIPWVDLETQKIVGWFALGNIALASAILFGFLDFSVRKGFPISKLFFGIPARPTTPNGVALGVIDEEAPKKRPHWLDLRRKALNGNILITGSIGTGKTQGALFPCLDQVLARFSPKPALLAIDPKGKIIERGIEMAKSHGLASQIVRISLGGSETFNPIFEENALRSGKFTSIAKMIRSASVNFMGKSFDTPFWEREAEALIRNGLIVCAATLPYYTLNDLYRVLVEASVKDSPTLKHLKAALGSERFDEEEKTNIQFAMDFFKRFQLLDDKVRTGILATSTTFLSQFQEYQASAIFCPPREKLTIRSMDQILEEGKLLFLDIKNEGLARSMGTFIKLHYESAVLNRLKHGKSTERPAVLLIDEYQDVVTTGFGTDLGDETFLSEGREANAITIVATPSLTHLENAIGRDKPTQVLWSGFRTKILCNSNDLATIQAFQEIVGEEERPRISESYSRPNRPGLALGAWDASPAKASAGSESVSRASHKEYAITARDVSRLKSYEAFVMLYDGIESTFQKLFLKPYFLKKSNTSHRKILKLTQAAAAALAVTVGTNIMLPVKQAYAFPTVCTAMGSPEAHSCMNFTMGSCMCGWPIPRPCAQFSYFIPKTMIEAVPNSRDSFFQDYPGAAAQLQTMATSVMPFGTEDDDETHAFQAHALATPLASTAFALLPCGEIPITPPCFEAMSEDLGANWTTGSADSLQPNFLAWGVSPKACLLRGALASGTGEGGTTAPASSAPSCSVPLGWVPKYPPSTHPACTGWGTFYPRSGVYHGGSQTLAALMVASRMKSLGAEVFHTVSSSSDEQWQMLYPQSSSCFREGQNAAALEGPLNAREVGRLTSGHLKGYLFSVWEHVSCCRDLALVPTAIAAIESITASCQLGGI